MKILIADDDPNIHVVISLWLGRKGHDTVSVRNGADAIETLKSETFDVLISDVNMPGMTGIELIQTALHLGTLPELVVVLTSRCDKKALANQIGSTRVHFLNKPFSPSVLANLIDELSSEYVEQA